MKRKPLHALIAAIQSNRLYQWGRRRRRVAAHFLLRGVCYGTGTGTAGLIFWWFEHRS
ncbi:hypothetical protein [Streptomyces sp. NPDC005435]|uniref:hypothetical protein n=1 Tax=Streptomyces sp. NPDC005435 TaxID=3154464 RepID=UPI003456289F